MITYYRWSVFIIAFFLVNAAIWLPQSVWASGYSASSSQPLAGVYSPTSRQLPKTGPPVATLALIGLLPVGLKLRHYGKEI